MKTFADFRIDVPSGRGGEIDTTCPECSHTRRKKTARCLSVNVEKGTWACHHCGWTGGLLQGASKPDELHWRKPVYRRPIAQPQDDLPAVTFEWFLSRGINRDVV